MIAVNPDTCYMAAAFFAGMDIEHKHQKGKHHVGAIVIGVGFFLIGAFYS